MKTKPTIVIFGVLFVLSAAFTFISYYELFALQGRLWGFRYLMMAMGLTIASYSLLVTLEAILRKEE